MALVKNAGRQEVIAARQTIKWDSTADDTGVAQGAVELPEGAVVVGGFVNVKVAFNSTTSDSLDLGDGDDDDLYTPTAVDLQAVGVTVIPVVGKQYSAQDNIDAKWTAGATGTATAGEVDIIVQYIVANRAAFAQG